MFGKNKKFKMKDLLQAKKLVEELNKADNKRRSTRTKLRDLGLTDKMVSILQDKPGIEIIEFGHTKIIYNTTEQVKPQCDWYGERQQKMKALPNGKLQVEESYT